MKKFICLACGKEFESMHVGRNPKYCSRKCTGAKMTGVTPWNKGVEMWKDREHPRGTLGKTLPTKGKKLSDERKKQISEVHNGIKYPTLSAGNHWNWKGGIAKERDKVKHTQEYKDWRTAVFTRDGYTCQSCGTKGGSLEAHHLKSNGQTLCKVCHRKTDTYGKNK